MTSDTSASSTPATSSFVTVTATEPAARPAAPGPDTAWDTTACRSPSTSSSTAVTVTVRGVLQSPVVKVRAPLTLATPAASLAGVTVTLSDGAASSTTVYVASRSSPGVTGSSISATVTPEVESVTPVPSSFTTVTRTNDTTPS